MDYCDFRKNQNYFVAFLENRCYFTEQDMKRPRNAFTLIEMLIVITIISILAAMAITSISNSAKDSRTVIAQQQLAVIQEAVNSYASRQIGRVLPAQTAAFGAITYTGKQATVEDVRNIYNSPPRGATAVKISDRLTLIRSYLDASNFGANLIADDTAGSLTTEAMRAIGKKVELPDWVSGDFPKAQMPQ